MAKIANVYVYGDIDNGPADMADMFGFVSLASVQKQIANAGEFDKIKVHIHSRGGLVTEGFAIHDYLKSLQKPIETVIEGLCASIATVISAAGSVRLMTPNSEFFIHNPWTATEGDAADLARMADELLANEDKLAKFYAGVTGGDFDKIKQLMANDTTLTAEQALEYGFITAIAEPVKAYAKVGISKSLTDEEKITQKITNDIMNKIQSFMQKHGLIKAQVKALQVTDEQGAVYYTLAVEVGQVMYTDEAMTTPAPAGTYNIDGYEVVVADAGVITSVSEIVDVEALKAENAALKAELEAKNSIEKDAELVAEKAEEVVAEKEAEIEELKAEIQALKGNVKSAYVPKDRQKEVIAKKADKSEEDNRIADAKDRRASYKPQAKQL